MGILNLLHIFQPRISMIPHSNAISLKCIIFWGRHNFFYIPYQMCINLPLEMQHNKDPSITKVLWCLEQGKFET
jgi:hypothetical protein